MYLYLQLWSLTVKLALEFISIVSEALVVERFEQLPQITILENSQLTLYPENEFLLLKYSHATYWKNYSNILNAWWYDLIRHQ